MERLSVMTDPRKPASYELASGISIGKYEILRRLAVGGMAEIYLARVRGTAGFEKLVVLKRILPNVAEDPSFVTMFLDEARLAATLQHPNIADVYDVGEVDGTYFFTMEYVHGQDVRTIRQTTRKRNEVAPLPIALAIVHGTASALDYAHEKTGPDGQPLGIVHRDVSASNVLVSYDGAIKLVDFGIARAAGSQHKTRTGTLKGKIPYMSPEQCKGLPMDRRSDLFSLGVVLYELTVGRRPFRGESDFAIMDQIVYKGAVAPSQIAADYPAALEAIVMKLLERAPGDRYATGEELIHELEQLISRQQLWVSAKPLGKYMRALFADKIAAWEQAEREGVTLGQYVAETITAQSQHSDLVTPPSLVAVESAPLPMSSPTFEGRSHKRSLRIGATALVLAAGAIGGYLWLGSGPTDSRKSLTQPVIEQPSASPAPALTQPMPGRQETQAAGPSGLTQPDLARPGLPGVTQPDPTVTPQPIQPASVVHPPAAASLTQPEVGHRRNAKAVIRPAPKPSAKPETKPDKPETKEPTWDPNSPFLPQ